jgi:hypothetical protein
MPVRLSGLLTGGSLHSFLLTIQKNTETLIYATSSRDVGLEMNIDENKYMLLLLRQNAGQNRNMKTQYQTAHLKICHISNTWERQ